MGKRGDASDFGLATLPGFTLPPHVLLAAPLSGLVRSKRQRGDIFDTGRGPPCPVPDPGAALCWPALQLNKGLRFLINNRQNRRRGRGGQRGGNQNRGQPNRGNAAQLLEKYKGLARDAQMQGDRVQAEYYLQYADHYFRVLEEHNAQKDERQNQQPKPRKKSQRDDDRDERDEQDNDRDDEAQAEDKPKPKRQRKPKADAEGNEGANEAPKPRKRGRPKKEDGDSIADALPPAISSDEADAA